MITGRLVSNINTVVIRQFLHPAFFNSAWTTFVETANSGGELCSRRSGEKHCVTTLITAAKETTSCEVL